MRATKELAREICRELGIEWDEDDCEPTLQGKPIQTEPHTPLNDVQTVAD